MKPTLVHKETEAISMEDGAASTMVNPKDLLLKKDTNKVKEDSYGPWIHVDYGRKSGKNFRFQNKWIRQTGNEKKTINGDVERQDDMGGGIAGNDRTILENPYSRGCEKNKKVVPIKNGIETLTVNS